MNMVEDTNGSFDIDGDPWLAADKLYHFLFCFSLTILFSSFASLSRFPLLRAYSIGLGSLLSLAAGAAKEFADHLGFFRSSGASARDAVADVLGVFVAAIGLSLWFKCVRRTRDPARAKRILPL